MNAAGAWQTERLWNYSAAGSRVKQAPDGGETGSSARAKPQRERTFVEPIEQFSFGPQGRSVIAVCGDENRTRRRRTSPDRVCLYLDAALCTATPLHDTAIRV